MDAYNDPHAASDLAVYRSQYGLPACTTSTGCLNTYGSATGWMVFGGTSVAAPLIAGVYAAAGSHTVSYPAKIAYSHTSSLFDVTTGHTASCSPAYLCTAESAMTVRPVSAPRTA